MAGWMGSQTAPARLASTVQPILRARGALITKKAALCHVRDGLQLNVEQYLLPSERSKK